MDQDKKTIWMTRKEAAQYLRVSVSTMAHWVQSGMGPRHFIAGGKARYLREDLDCWAMREEFEPLPMKLQNYVLSKHSTAETDREQDARICQTLKEEVEEEMFEEFKLVVNMLRSRNRTI